MTKVAKLLVEAGAEYVVSCATHGLFSGDAVAAVNACTALREVIVTDSTPQVLRRLVCVLPVVLTERASVLAFYFAILQWSNIEKCPKLTVLSVAPLLALAIERVHYESAYQEDEWETDDWSLSVFAACTFLTRPLLFHEANQGEFNRLIS